MKEQFELFITFLQERGLTPPQERSMRRQFLRTELMALIHRPASDCPQALIDREIELAEARLKRPKHEKEEFTPDKPATWQTAFLVTPQVVRVNEQTKRRQGMRIRKDWGKGGVKLNNTIVQAKANSVKWQDNAEYACLPIEKPSTTALALIKKARTERNKKWAKRNIEAQKQRES